MPRKHRPKKFNAIKEVKRRARLSVGVPPSVRVADAGEKRRRQSERPKHKPDLQQLLDGNQV